MKGKDNGGLTLLARVRK